MAIQFRKATKKQSKLRLSIAGSSGSGKTYTALNIGKHLGGRIALIDTERGSASKYSDIFEFDVIELESFHPEAYIEAIEAAEKAEYDILIIDSITHEWNSRDGVLELHEAAIRKQKTKNSYMAWADVTPLHTRFIDSIVRSRCHVITTMRSKIDYVQETNERGQTVVRKVGMAPIQREGMDYEHDVAMELDIDHVGVITKTRCAALDGKVFKKPGREFAEILIGWLTDGAEPAPRMETKEPTDQSVATRQHHDREVIVERIKAIIVSMGKESEWLAYEAKHVYGATPEDLMKLIRRLEEAASKKLVEEIEGPIFESLGLIGVGGKEALEKIAQIAEGECGLEQMDYAMLVEVRDGLSAWAGQMKQEGAKAA